MHIVLDSLTFLLLSAFLNQVLHQEPKADNWTQSVGGSLRTGAARYKQMAAYSKDHFCGAYLEFFQTYHKLAAQHLAAMNTWYNETYKILNTQADYSLEDLQAFLDSANGEFRPPAHCPASIFTSFSTN
jgi:hypothetical protein